MYMLYAIEAILKNISKLFTWIRQKLKYDKNKQGPEENRLCVLQVILNKNAYIYKK